MADVLDLSHFIRRRADGAATMDFAIEGIDCAACIDDIEGGLRPLAGVLEARLNYTNRRLSVVWNDREAAAQTIVDRLARMGYRAHPFELRHLEAEDAERMRWLLRCLAVASFAMMNVMLLSVSVWAGAITDITAETRDFFHWLSALLVLPAAAYAGQPFFRSAYAALRARRLNMDVPISLGIVLALGMSLFETLNHAEHAYFDSAAMLLVFLLAGRTLDHMMRARMRTAAANIVALKGDFAHRLDEQGALVDVPIAVLRVGDRVLVPPGDRVPADAVVVAGLSSLDESAITGETDRRPVEQGTKVWAGTLNGEGALTLRVTAAGESSLIDEVRRLVERAGEAKSRYRILADRAAAIYAPMVHLTALLTVVGWLAMGASVHDALVTAIAVLIITCPCALALAAPAVQVVAAGALMRNGIYLNASDAIERLAEVDHVVFDKTGTLTLPMRRVANAADIPPDLLSLAARLALSSRHPLAMAVAQAGGAEMPFEAVVEKAGEGVSAQVDGVEIRLGSPAFCGVQPAGPSASDVSTLCVRAGERTAVIEIRQTLRADAAAVVAALKARGLGVSILSGDRPEAVAPVAQALGVADWRGGARPADKIAAIADLTRTGRRVLMIGDGLNDAPALAGAHASLSPMDGVDLARAGADAMFSGERLGPVVVALDLSRTARALMRQNLFLAFAYNVVAVPLAVAGMATPLIAAAAMSGSSILVTLNALRAAIRRPKVRTPSAPAAASLPSGVRKAWS